jgi:DNA-binding XRE family transcriptional regulator
MESTDTMSLHKIHHGRNVKRFREMLGIKQDVLAEEIGFSQQTISRLESQEELDEVTLTKIAKALRIPVEAIKNFSDETAVNIISNTFTSNDASTLYQNGLNHSCTFNPIEKIVELYERMLKTEQEKVTMLQDVLRDKK